MASHHVLLIGGNGRISKLLTPLLLQRAWTVTSLIHNPEHIPSLQKLAENQKGKLDVLARSLEDVKSQAQAQSVLDEVKPDYVVWSAGAGGKGPDRTFAIDRDAAIHFIRASAATPTITKFVMISWLSSRLKKPAWWDDAAYAESLEQIEGGLKKYTKAKIAADEVLYTESKKRPDFAGINLRPGFLSDDPAGKVALGKLPSPEGLASTASVANLAALLLDADGVKNCWLDMLDGNEDPKEAVERCVREGVDAAEGEPFY